LRIRQDHYSYIAVGWPVMGEPASKLTVTSPAACRTERVLRADIYGPTAPGRYPVLLCRTPYNKQRPTYVQTASELAASGYVAIVQDVRGRYASEGSWTFSRSAEAISHEQMDGAATAEWAASLPSSDGQLGTWGNSYCSRLAWQLAAANPPSLKAAHISGSAMRTLDVNFGIFETGLALSSMYNMAADLRPRVRHGLGP
jgi:putative CocE/NonD family hydrolase